MSSTSLRLLLVGMAVSMIGGACSFLGEVGKPPLPVEVVNNTEQEIVIVESAGPDQSTNRVPAGRRSAVGATTDDEDCLVRALTATTASGQVLETLAAGTCLEDGEPIEWVVDD